MALPADAVHVRTCPLCEAMCGLRGSWMHNVPSLVSGRESCTLLIHPEDAARAGLVNGARALEASSWRRSR